MHLEGFVPVRRIPTDSHVGSKEGGPCRFGEGAGYRDGAALCVYSAFRLKPSFTNFGS